MYTHTHIYIYIYKTRLALKEIFSPSNKLHREVGRAKDLPARRYTARWHFTISSITAAGPAFKCFTPVFSASI